MYTQQEFNQAKSYIENRSYLRVLPVGVNKATPWGSIVKTAVEETGLMVLVNSTEGSYRICKIQDFIGADIFITTYKVGTVSDFLAIALGGWEIRDEYNSLACLSKVIGSSAVSSMSQSVANINVRSYRKKHK